MTKTKNQKTIELQKDIGDKLFSLLGEEDRKFILETEGIINLGYKATEKDIVRICRMMEG